MVEVAEVWKAVPGYEGFYEVSSFGRIRGLPRTVPVVRLGRVVQRRLPGKLFMQSTLSHDGYSRVLLRRGGRQKMVCVHRLVALAFHGDKRNALHNEVAHLDGCRTNPRADNLRWVSKVENMSHKVLHGTSAAGERHPLARFTNDQVIAIKLALLAGASQSAIAKRHGVTVSAIHDIARGKNWRGIGFRGRIRGHAGRGPGGGSSQTGALNHNAKVTAEQAADIRRRAERGESVPSLGREYGMSRAAAYKLVRGDTYPVRPTHILPHMVGV